MANPAGAAAVKGGVGAAASTGVAKGYQETQPDTTTHAPQSNGEMAPLRFDLWPEELKQKYGIA
jgi:hypothetical protein